MSTTYARTTAGYLVNSDRGVYLGALERDGRRWIIADTARGTLPGEPARYATRAAATDALVVMLEAATKLDALPTDDCAADPGDADGTCAVCGDELAPERFGYTCGDECADLWATPGTLSTVVEATDVEDTHRVVTERGDVLGELAEVAPGEYEVTVAEDGAWISVTGTRRDAVLALVRRQRELDDEHPRDCACSTCYPIEPSDVFVAGDRVRHASGQTGTVVVGTHRGDVVPDDLWVTVAWDGDGDERHHPSTLTRVAPAVRCSGCDANVVVTADERGATTYCGGDGDGVCDMLVAGDPAAVQSHADAVAAALVSAR